MSLEDRIMSVLVAHESHFKCTSDGTYDGRLHCDCEQWSDDTCAQFEEHRKHVAEQIAPLMRIRDDVLQSQAWDRGWNAGWDDNSDDGVLPKHENPYRKALQ